VAGICAVSCADQMKDGAETDVDCGGPVCPPCGPSEKCLSDGDCASPLLCAAEVCVDLPLWSRVYGDDSNQQASAVAFSPKDGSVWVAGAFQGTLAPYPGPTSAGGYDAFVMKLDAAGNVLFVKTFGDAADQLATGIAVDPSTGDAYVTGYFEGNIVSGAAYTSAGSYDVFLLKLDAMGEVSWVKRFGDADQQIATAVACSASGRVGLTGYFAGTIDLGGGALASAGDDDIFFGSFDAAGTPVQSTRFGDEAAQHPQGIAATAADGFVLTGWYQTASGFSFGGSAVPPAAGPDVDAFVVLLDGTATPTWAVGLGAMFARANAVAVAQDGSVVVAGDAIVAATLLGLPCSGTNEIFLAKLDASGNPEFVRCFAASAGDSGAALALDSTDTILLGVSLDFGKGSLDLGNGPLQSPLPTCPVPTSSFALAVARYSADGVPLDDWTLASCGGAPTIVPPSLGVSADAIDDVLVAGTFQGTTFSFGAAPLSTCGQLDNVFVARYPR
jgi:hypothetical protein